MHTSSKRQNLWKWNGETNLFDGIFNPIGKGCCCVAVSLVLLFVYFPLALDGMSCADAPAIDTNMCFVVIVECEAGQREQQQQQPNNQTAE